MKKLALGSALDDWREELAEPVPDQKAGLPTVGSAVPIAENVICFFRDNDDLDLAMTPRGMGALAGTNRFSPSVLAPYGIPRKI